MSQVEYMVGLIQQVWSDAMSDNGSIWAKSNAQLEKAKAESPEVYAQAMASLGRSVY